MAKIYNLKETIGQEFSFNINILITCHRNDEKRSGNA